jgi:hypothetical protein
MPNRAWSAAPSPAPITPAGVWSARKKPTAIKTGSDDYVLTAAPDIPRSL